VLNQILKQCKFASGIVITFQVMAFSGMSPGNPDAVGSFPQSCQEKLRAHASRAGNTDNPDIGWIFHPAHSGKIGGTITTPVA
jgi:hypothetical protein